MLERCQAICGTKWSDGCSVFIMTTKCQSILSFVERSLLVSFSRFHSRVTFQCITRWDAIKEPIAFHPLMERWMGKLNLSSFWPDSFLCQSLVTDWKWKLCIKYNMSGGTHFKVVVVVFYTVTAASIKGRFTFHSLHPDIFQTIIFVWGVREAKWQRVTLSPLLQWRAELQHCCQCQMPALKEPEANGTRIPQSLHFKTAPACSFQMGTDCVKQLPLSQLLLPSGFFFAVLKVF